MAPGLSSEELDERTVDESTKHRGQDHEPDPKRRDEGVGLPPGSRVVQVPGEGQRAPRDEVAEDNGAQARANTHDERDSDQAGRARLEPSPKLLRQLLSGQNSRQPSTFHRSAVLGIRHARGQRLAREPTRRDARVDDDARSSVGGSR